VLRSFALFITLAIASCSPAAKAPEEKTTAAPMEQSNGTAVLARAKTDCQTEVGLAPDCLLKQANLVQGFHIRDISVTSSSMPPKLALCVAALNNYLCTNSCPELIIDNQGNCSVRMAAHRTFK
jgi:hypothetical protein